jgi:hypothetical protein
MAVTETVRPRRRSRGLGIQHRSCRHSARQVKKTPKAPVQGKDPRPIPLPGALFLIKPTRNATPNLGNSQVTAITP